MTSAKDQSPKIFFWKLMKFLFFKFELSLKDKFNLKPIFKNLPQFKPTGYSFRKISQNGNILFGSYVMTQNVDTDNLKISQCGSLVE